MKSPLRIIIPAAICCITLFVLAAFRTVPQSRLWKGWTVLYVTSETLSEGDIYKVLVENGCENVITKSMQRDPIVSPISPLQAQAQNSYIVRRNAFFSDADDKAMLFYIPDNEETALSHAIAALERVGGTSCGTDGAASFPYAAPCLVLLFAACLVLFSKRKILFALSAFFLVCMSFSRPLFTVAACASLALTGIFLLEKLYGRKGATVRIARSPLAVLLIVLPVFVLCASNVRNAVFYVLALAASVSAILLFEEVKAWYYSRFPHAFAPVYIRSAFGMELVRRTDMRALLALTVSCVCVLGASVFGQRIQASGNATDRPALPAPSTRASGGLPDLQDFLAWSWKTASFPYIKLSTPQSASQIEETYPREGETVTTTSFTEAGGTIQKKEDVVLVFDSTFREHVFDAVKKAPYPALENMLLKQGRGVSYAYVRGGRAVAERLGTLLLSVCAVVSLGMTVYFGGRRKYGIGK